MEDLFGFLFLLFVFIVAPLLEGAKKRKQRQQQQQQQQQRPQPRRVPQRTPESLPPAPMQQRHSETEEYSAATMVPDELWEILTGQPRPRPAPQPVPQAPDVELEEIEDEVSVFEDVIIEERRRSREREEAVSLEELPRREYPVVVSMETPVPTPRQRHVAFHRKLESPVVPAVAVARAAHGGLPLNNPKELRRAILLQTILGPPRALE